VPNVPSVPTYNQPTYSAPAYSAPASSSVGSSAGGGSHTVASGENLYRISLKHGTSVAAIKNANGLTGDAIRTGQKLIIP
jgi:LysM repeat protein